VSDTKYGDPGELLAALPFAIDIAWRHVTGIHVMDGERRAKLVLSEHGHGSEYEGLVVEVVSKLTGRIDRTWLPFAPLVPPPRVTVSMPRAHVYHDGRGSWMWYAPPEGHNAGLLAYCQSVEAHIEAWR
jgi:hypothetical protein